MSSFTGESNREYLQRIDDAVSQSQALQDWLLWRSAQAGGKPTARTKLFIESLKNPVPSKDWVDDPSLAPFLPILLRSASKPTDFSTLEPWYQLLFERPGGLWGLVRRFYYPISIAIAAMIVFYYFSLAIIPVFESLFIDYQLRLPAPTKFVFGIANFVADFTFLALVQILFGIALLLGMIRLVGLFLDRFEGWSIVRFLRRGTKRSLGSMARWSGTLSELLRVGMPADQAIATAGLSSCRPWLKDQSLKLASAGKLEPNKLWSVHPQARQFSASCMAALDEHQRGSSGVSVLREISNSYALRWASRESISYTWLGPIVILLVAKMVLFLVLSLFMPLLSLLTSLSG